MARVVPGRIVVGDPDVDNVDECPDCGFDAVLTFPLHVLTAEGVAPFGTYRSCARCYDVKGHL